MNLKKLISKKLNYGTNYSGGRNNKGIITIRNRVV